MQLEFYPAMKFCFAVVVVILVFFSFWFIKFICTLYINAVITPAQGVSTCLQRLLCVSWQRPGDGWAHRPRQMQPCARSEEPPGSWPRLPQAHRDSQGSSFPVFIGSRSKESLMLVLSFFTRVILTWGAVQASEPSLRSFCHCSWFVPLRWGLKFGGTLTSKWSI